MARQSEIIQTNLRKRSVEMMNIVMEEVRRRAYMKLTEGPLHVQSGVLRTNVQHSVKVKNLQGGVEGRIGTNVWYGRMWELTGIPKAYDIFPVTRRALRWPTAYAIGYRRGTGEVFASRRKMNVPNALPGVAAYAFAKHVHHPAVPAKPFLKPAIEETGPFLVAMHNKYFTAAFEVPPMILLASFATARVTGANPRK